MPLYQVANIRHLIPFSPSLDQNTMWCRYNVVSFLTNIHERHSIARPLVVIYVVLYNIGLHYNGT